MAVFTPVTIIGLLVWLAVTGVFVFLVILLIRTLLKYLRSGPVRQEKDAVKRSLGEVIRARRTACNMTQEFVAEALGVSRQAVSKWEKGLALVKDTQLKASPHDTFLTSDATGRRCTPPARCISKFRHDLH